MAPRPAPFKAFPVNSENSLTTDFRTLSLPAGLLCPFSRKTGQHHHYLHPAGRTIRLEAYQPARPLAKAQLVCLQHPFVMTSRLAVHPSKALTGSWSISSSTARVSMAATSERQTGAWE